MSERDADIEQIVRFAEKAYGDGSISASVTIQLARCCATARAERDRAREVERSTAEQNRLLFEAGAAVEGEAERLRAASAELIAALRAQGVYDCSAVHTWALGQERAELEGVSGRRESHLRLYDALIALEAALGKGDDGGDNHEVNANHADRGHHERGQK